MRKIVIALPKGKRLLGKAYDIFKNAGYVSATLEQEIQGKQRKQLEFVSDCGSITFLLVRNADIPQYIDRSWADAGVTAFDCYREYELAHTTAKHSMRGENFTSSLLPPLDLCPKARFCVAGRPEVLADYEQAKTNREKIITVATGYPYIAGKYFRDKGIIADIILVSGSTELMPKHGEVDVIFDIVETGRALEENGLVVFEEAMPIMTKVLVSRAALKYDPNVEVFINAIKSKLG